MLAKLNGEARRVMEVAAEEARGLGHGYVGTEHVLLGLVGEGGEVGRVLAGRGATVERVRAAVEEMVTRGPDGHGDLPLTPRARRVVELAGEEARYVSQGVVGMEHLLLGVLRETEGVGGKVLEKLGVKADEVRGEVLRVRYGQLRLVERAVRPVRAGAGRKRKMREELLAHLTAIYEDELVRVGDADRAMAEAAGRFGDVGELAGELAGSVPWGERFEYAVGRQLGWRAPESALRYVARVTGQLAILMGAMWCVAAVSAGLAMGWGGAAWEPLRPVTAMAVLLPLSVGCVELLYYRLRDSLWGVFGSRRSMLRVVWLEVLVWASVVAVGAVYGAVAIGGVSGAVRMALPCAGAAVAVALVVAYRARVMGPGEITDTVWECLDVG